MVPFRGFCLFRRQSTTPETFNANNREYTCFLCCHVRMGAVFLGILHLMKDLLGLTVITAWSLHVGNSGLFSFSSESATNSSLTNRTLQLSNANTTSAEQRMWDFDNAWNWNCEDKFLGFLLMLGSAFLAISMLYGVITAKPRYILPFFWLLMFDFCVTCLTFIGYFSYGPDIKSWLAVQKSFPLKDELMKLSGEWLMAIAAIISLIFIWIKAYCIRVIWYCYKFLVVRDSRPPLLAHFSSDTPVIVGGDGPEDHTIRDAEMILPPKYEDVVPADATNDLPGIIPPPAYDSLVLTNENEGAPNREINN